MAPKTNVAFPSKARDTDKKHRRLAERWRKALPTCADCGRVCFYGEADNTWMCWEPQHGVQWNGPTLAFVRRYRPTP